MEFLKAKIGRTKIGEIAYFSINATLPLVLLLLIYSFNSAYPALGLVLLSKWRILALRPRFWWINIKANAVDLMVGISVVGLMYIAMPVLWLQLLLAFAYIAWLVYLKAKSTSTAILVQAGIAQFVSLTMLFGLSTNMPELIVVLACWAIGYSVARHVTSNYDEDYVELLSLTWGMLVAQFGWLFYHWTVAYDLNVPIKIPQAALVVMIISFAAARLYSACKTKKLDSIFVRSTIVFSIVLLVITIAFSRWDVAI